MNYSLESIISSAKRVQDELDKKDAEIARLSTPLGKFQPYQKTERVEWRSFGTRKPGDWFDPTLETEKKRHEETLIAMNAQLEIAKQNAVIWKANGELLSKVIDLVAAVGLVKTWSKTTYGRKIKTTTEDSPWYAALRASCPRPPHTESDDKVWIDNLNQSFKTYSEALAAKEKAAKAKIEAEEKQRKETAKIIKVAMQINYEGDMSAVTADELMDDLRARDKYLDLAAAMEETRGDWSDGFGRVKHALGRFKIEDDRDAAIVDDVSSCAYGEETDGRIFRDCDWNYGKIYELANDKIAAWYNELAEFKS